MRAVPLFVRVIRYLAFRVAFGEQCLDERGILNVLSSPPRLNGFWVIAENINAQFPMQGRFSGELFR